MGSKEDVSLVKGEGTSMKEMCNSTSAENQQLKPPTTWSGLHEGLVLDGTRTQEDGRDVSIHHQ